MKNASIFTGFSDCTWLNTLLAMCWFLTRHRSKNSVLLGSVDHSHTVTYRGNGGRTIFSFFPLQSLSRSPFHVCFWANNVLSQHNRPLILLYNKQAFRSGHMQELLIKMQQATPPPSSHTRANITTRVHTLTHTNENILYSDLTLPHEQTKQCSLEEWAHDHNSPLHWHYCDHLHIFTFLQTTFEMQQRNICFSLHVSLSRGRCALLFPIYLLLSPSLDTKGRSSAEYTAQWPIIPHIKPQAWTNTISNASLFRSSIPQ